LELLELEINHTQLPVVESDSAVSTSAVSAETTEKATDWFSLAIWAYSAGMLIALLLYLRSYSKLLRIDTHPAKGLPLEIWRDLQANKKYKDALMMTDAQLNPMIFGLLKIKVLLPSESVNWSRGKLKSTLIHEANHLQYKDVITRFISSITRIALWFHPLVWLVHKELIIAQEESCDLSVLQSGVYPEDYAEDLLSVCKSSQNFNEALAMAKFSQLGKRVRLVLNMENQSMGYNTKLGNGLSLTTLVAVGVLSCVGFAQKSLDPQLDTKFEELTDNAPLIENKKQSGDVKGAHEVRNLAFACVNMQQLLNENYDLKIAREIVTAKQKELARMNLEKLKSIQIRSSNLAEIKKLTLGKRSNPEHAQELKKISKEITKLEDNRKTWHFNENKKIQSFLSDYFHKALDEENARVKQFAIENGIQMVLDYSSKSSTMLAVPTSFNPETDITKYLLKK